ncbi:hypothetical protein GCM10011571_16130 [Marinithermofilum abyssi]|uniref:Uncharacterized protein n=1 Tax=Marinithermofilum abyssi TaxID=1571185 RepID=A0A8J2VID5_9BACL|nr:hypothetical protein GCM10011571_16130 [Marinithermofilum abyssi]
MYGKGEQKKPMITLEDDIRSLVRTVELPADGGFHVYNQATMLISPKDLSKRCFFRGDLPPYRTFLSSYSNIRGIKGQYIPFSL